ncbi:MAG: SDR family oxidoreductase [Sphingomonadales bacterium]|nr:SDR family oxidoreductase [Sphingomonadales bacterium]
MKLVIFGATGSIGRHIVNQALAQGHEVIVFARTPTALNMNHPNLTLVAGDVFNPSSVAAAVRGCDGVVIALGSTKLTGKLRSIGTKHIVAAMEEHGVKRLVCLSTLGVGDSRANLDFFWKYLMFGMLLRFVFNDHVEQERIVKNSGLNWVIARPAAFTNDPVRGNYKQGFGVEEKGLKLKIARQDVASFMLQQLTEDENLHKAVGLSY